MAWVIVGSEALVFVMVLGMAVVMMALSVSSLILLSLFKISFGLILLFFR